MFHWCSLSLVIAAIAWYLLRKIIRKVTSNDELILYIDEFSGNIFSGVFIMELGIIASEDGVYSVTHVLCGFINLLIRNSYFTYESPCGFVDSYYTNGRKFILPLLHLGINVFCQIAGMVLGQYLARFMWSFDAFDSHSHTEALNIVCQSSISSSHSVASVAFAEFLGTFTMCVAAYFVASKFVPLTVTAVAYINFFFFTHVSGSFYNQSMSTAFTFHCDGYRSDLEFFFIYWVAPTVGQIAAWELLMAGSKLLKREKAEKVE